jgi:hypothetical protein
MSDNDGLPRYEDVVAGTSRDSKYTATKHDPKYDNARRLIILRQLKNIRFELDIYINQSYKSPIIITNISDEREREHVMKHLLGKDYQSGNRIIEMDVLNENFISTLCNFNTLLQNEIQPTKKQTTFFSYFKKTEQEIIPFKKYTLVFRNADNILHYRHRMNKIHGSNSHSSLHLYKLLKSDGLVGNIKEWHIDIVSKSIKKMMDTQYKRINFIFTSNKDLNEFSHLIVSRSMIIDFNF